MLVASKHWMLLHTGGFYTEILHRDSTHWRLLHTGGFYTEILHTGDFYTLEASFYTLGASTQWRLNCLLIY